MQQHLYLIRGVPGSGKSTFANECLNASIVCEADKWFDKFNGGIFDATHLSHAHTWCLEEAKQGLILGHNVAVANTFTRRWEMQHYYDMVAKLTADSEFKIKIFEIIANGAFDNVHNVPEAKVREMQRRFEF